MTRRAPLGHLAAVAAVAVLLAGCGSESTPAESAPELAEGLERVDAAIVDGKDPAARDAVRALVADTEEALAAGEIEQAQADAILAAADALLDELGAAEPPKPQEPVTPESDETTESPEVQPEDPEPSEEDEKPEKDEKPGKGHGKAKGHDDDDDEDDD